MSPAVIFNPRVEGFCRGIKDLLSPIPEAHPPHGHEGLLENLLIDVQSETRRVNQVSPSPHQALSIGASPLTCKHAVRQPPGSCLAGPIRSSPKLNANLKRRLGVTPLPHFWLLRRSASLPFR